MRWALSVLLWGLVLPAWVRILTALPGRVPSCRLCCMPAADRLFCSFNTKKFISAAHTVKCLLNGQKNYT